MGFACRFLPGLRIAIGVTCASAKVPAMRFSSANIAGAFTWASTVMAFVAWGGPAWLARSGLPAWAVPVLPAAGVLAVAALMSRTQSVQETKDAGRNQEDDGKGAQLIANVRAVTDNQVVEQRGGSSSETD